MDNMNYKDYRFTEAEVTLDKEKYTALFPKEHSKVKGIVLRTVNENYWDSYANIPDYRTLCYLLWKGSKEWKKEYGGVARNFNIKGTHLNALEGIFNVLFALEKDDVRAAYLQKREIVELKTTIKKSKKRLEELAKS